MFSAIDLRGGDGAGLGGDMRRDGDVGMGPVGMVRRQRLGPEHVERRMADPPGIERREKAVVVDQRARGPD